MNKNTANSMCIGMAVGIALGMLAGVAVGEWSKSK